MRKSGLSDGSRRLTRSCTPTPPPDPPPLPREERGARVPLYAGRCPDRLVVDQELVAKGSLPWLARLVYAATRVIV